MSFEVEDRVAGATERLLGEGTPFTRLGVSEIANAAGIARSTFYVHFADKSDLLLRLAARAMDDLRDALDRWWARRRSGDDRALTECMLRVIDAYRAHATVLAAVGEVAGYDPAVATVWRARVDRYARRLRLELEEDRRRGVIGAGLDVEVAPFVVTWSIERTVAEHVRSSSPTEDRALARALSHFCRSTYA
ncbi:MAG: TetR/AcrR family transcriptional regulator [Chloroflexi bacterium]|nr:MAG: TetR/AcrR family transcriptional regulator [Chloroflexota bacterium]